MRTTDRNFFCHSGCKSRGVLKSRGETAGQGRIQIAENAAPAGHPDPERRTKSVIAPIGGVRMHGARSKARDELPRVRFQSPARNAAITYNTMSNGIVV